MLSATRQASTMRVACLGGGPAGLYLAISMKRRQPAHEIVVVERNRALRHLRLGRRALERDARQPRCERSAETAAAIRAGVRLLGRHRGPLPRPGHALRRPRLQRHRPAAPAQHPAGPRPRARRGAAVRDGSRWPGGLARLGPRGRRRRRQLEGAHRAGATSSSPTSTSGPASTSGWAPGRSSTMRSRSSSRRRRTAGCGRMPTSSTPTRRRSSSNARGQTWRRGRLRSDGRRADRGRLRADLRQEPRRPPADDQRAPPARIGVAQLQPGALRALEPRERRPARRRGGDRAFLDRVGHQARDGERDRARRLRGPRARPAPRRSGATRTSAASRC